MFVCFWCYTMIRLNTSSYSYMEHWASTGYVYVTFNGLAIYDVRLHVRLMDGSLGYSDFWTGS